MIFHRNVLSDIHKYYAGTYVKFKETGDRLWYIKHINDYDIMCTDVDGFTIYIDLNEEYEVDFALPGRAVYQSGDSAFMLYRKPAKQYFRGISSSNTQMMRLHRNGQWEAVLLTHERLQQFVDKPSYQDINNVNFNEYQSVALNPVFSVTKNGHVMALRQQVGSCDPLTKMIQVSHNIFTPELKALFKDWKFV